MKIKKLLSTLCMMTCFQNCSNSGFYAKNHHWENVVSVSYASASVESKTPRTLDYQCGVETAFNMASGSKFKWHATKTSGEVVTGTHDVIGTIASSSDLSAARMKIDFLPETVDTKVSLRNRRIMNYVFNTDLGFGLTFELNSVTLVSGSMMWPAPGEVSVYTLDGVLSVSGITSNISFNVEVTGDEQGFWVTPQDPDGISIDVRNTLGLTSQIADLLTQVPGVNMQNEVKFSFQLHMLPDCP